jgi:hypothetical protein
MNSCRDPSRSLSSQGWLLTPERAASSVASTLREATATRGRHRSAARLGLVDAIDLTKGFLNGD